MEILSIAQMFKDGSLHRALDRRDIDDGPRKCWIQETEPRRRMQQ